ncbi:signal peptidase complex catalytic subunit SEC11 [Mycena sp. CBHHK59/15]|nr:signal peptidase complex catalytic subunit SEC11 [Mycena sp. CBHHK59/15]
MWSTRARRVRPACLEYPRSLNISKYLLQAQVVALAMSSTLMSYSALGVLTNCKSPIVVVLSGSMEPGIYRGDILFLTNYASPYRTGDIAVYQVDGSPIPIVHRVVQTHGMPDNESLSYVLLLCVPICSLKCSPACPHSVQSLLTKGDNNDVDDLSLYRGLERLEKKHIVGKVRCILPLIGYVSIFFNEYSRLRNGMFGIVSLFGLLPT